MMGVIEGTHDPPQVRGPGRDRRLRARIGSAVAASLSPERTRRATLFERLTVRRLAWERLVRLNRWLAAAGKATTALWVVFLATVLLGVRWKQVVNDALNSGRPVEGALVLAIVLPTLAFVAARSAVGFARWRLQRELWRRDVERLEARGPRP